MNFWSGLGPISKYFSETKGSAIKFTILGDRGAFYNKTRGST
jgi:hypothetical protein